MEEYVDYIVLILVSAVVLPVAQAIREYLRVGKRTELGMQFLQQSKDGEDAAASFTFRELTGVNIRLSDVRKLSMRDDFQKVLDSVRLFPPFVAFENGSLRFRERTLFGRELSGFLRGLWYVWLIALVVLNIGGALWSGAVCVESMRAGSMVWKIVIQGGAAIASFLVFCWMAILLSWTHDMFSYVRTSGECE